MRNTFLGLGAEEWGSERLRSERLPVCPWTGKRLTVDELKGAIAMMLRRLDDEAVNAKKPAPTG